MSNEQFVTKLYDKQGNIIGALLTAEAWELVKDRFQEAPEVEERPEPISDWETLTEFWDFPYPVDYDVHCEHCSSETEDWRKDEPRKFRLSSATLAGLTTFNCQCCQARIIKRHFTDEITTECKPFTEKNAKLECRYNKK
ncbi:MAG: hypothetical protein ACNI27_00135 [Desulfovibrio sp.]